MKVSVCGQTLASRIRQFWDDLFTSRHVRFLEAELARVRAEKHAEIQRLASRPVRLFNELPAAQKPLMPQYTDFMGSYEAELARHNKSLEEEEKSNGIQKQ